MMIGIMEFTTIKLVYAFFAVFIPAHSFVDEKFDMFSGQYSVDEADMQSYLEKNLRITRGTEEYTEHRRPNRSYRRHTFPDYKHCCGGENSRNRTRKFKNKAAKVCAEKVNANLKEWQKFANPIEDQFLCEKLETVKNRHYCFADCLMKEFGVLNDEDKVQSDKAKELFTKDIATDWLKELAEKAVDKCATENEESRLYEREKLKCNPRAVFLKHCIWKEIVLICPEERFEKSEYCLRVKKSFEEMKEAE